MNNTKTNFITHPKVKHLLLFTGIWLLGIVLSTLAMTDLFTESFFQKNYIMSYFMMLLSITAIAKLYRNYWKNKKNLSKS